MGFKGIPSIGTERGYTSSHPTNADHLRHHPSVIIHVFQNLVIENRIKGLVGEGQRLAWRNHYTARPLLRLDFARALQLNLNAVHVGGVATESFGIHPKTTAHVK
jgi:hypothetical protein